MMVLVSIGVVATSCHATASMPLWSGTSSCQIWGRAAGCIASATGWPCATLPSRGLSPPGAAEQVIADGGAGDVVVERVADAERRVAEQDQVFDIVVEIITGATDPGIDRVVPLAGLFENEVVRRVDIEGVVAGIAVHPVIIAEMAVAMDDVVAIATHQDVGGEVVAADQRIVASLAVDRIGL